MNDLSEFVMNNQLHIRRCTEPLLRWFITTILPPEEVAHIENLLSLELLEYGRHYNWGLILEAASRHQTDDDQRVTSDSALKAGRAIRQAIDQEKAKEEIADPATNLSVLVLMAISRRRLLRRYLRGRFGCVIRWKRPRRTHLGPLDGDSYAMFQDAFDDYFDYDFLLFIAQSYIWLWAIKKLPLQEVVTEAALAMNGYIRDSPIVRLSRQIQSDKYHPEIREIATHQLSGWARTWINPTVNRRLLSSLQIERRPVEDVLQERLPGSLRLALEEQEASDPFTGKKSLISRVSAYLAAEEPLERKHHRIGCGKKATSEADGLMRTTDVNSLDSIPDQMAQDAYLRLESQLEIAVWTERAGLTPREAEILDLQLQDYTDVEIAERLKISPGTVKSTWSSARARLKQVGRQ